MGAVQNTQDGGQGGVTDVRSRCYDTAAPGESGDAHALTGAIGTHG